MRNTKSGATQSPIAIDLFCGVGGMSLGFEEAGFNVVAALDLEPINVEFHKKNFSKCQTVQADLSILDGKSFLRDIGVDRGSVDLVFGGPPCQGFSLIGKRCREDERNGLLLEFARLVGQIAPRYFVLENVPGLMAGDSLESFVSFRTSIRRRGYDLVEPVQLLNSKDFG